MSSKNNMRSIAIVTSIHPSFDKRVWRHARSMAEHGFHIYLICPWDVSNNREYKNITFYTFKIPKKRILRVFYSTFITTIMLLKVIKKIKLIHFHDIDILPIMTVFSFFKPVVYDVHENYAEEMLVREWIPKYLRQPLYYLVKYGQFFFSQIVKNVVLVTEAQEVDFISRRINKCIVKNYASKQLVKQVTDDFLMRPQAAIFIASHYELNGSLLLLDVVKILSEKSDNFIIYVSNRFGNPYFEKIWKQKLADFKLEHVIKILPNVPSTEIVHLLNKATIGLNIPLRVVKQERAINTKLFEYMAAGLPVITSDLQYPSAVINKTRCGLLVRPEDPNSIADAILQLFKDKPLAYEMGKKGQKAFLESYNWESQMVGLVQYYQQIL